MKGEKILSCVIAGTLAFLLAYSGLGCLVSAFGLEAGMGFLALVCVLASFGGAFLAGRKWGPWLSFGILALWGVRFLGSEAARGQLSYLFYHISDFYHRAYGWSRFGEIGPEGAAGVTRPLALLGALVAVTVSHGVVRRKSVLPGALAALLPLIACLVVTDTVPGAGWLYLMILALLLLVLTAGQRRGSEGQGNSLMLMAVIPTAVALGLLFWATPRESYVNEVPELYDRIWSWMEQFPGMTEKFKNESVSGGEEETQVDLRNTGPLLQRQYPVMDVSAPISGTMYLRGQDYDVYDGTGWTATPDRAEFFNGGESWLESQGTVTVATLSQRDHCYIPYYAGGSTKLIGGVVRNPQQDTAYGFALKTLPENWRELAGTSMEYVSQIGAASGLDSRYWALPEDTRLWAEELLKTILPENLTTARDRAEVIADYVRGSAEYDVNTPKMPGNQRDFARWFLTERDTGYCVHFASATALLLRAAGVPARYVSGYMFQAEAGTPVTVREYQAHAWVEYYEDQLGMWLVLESTPSAPEAPGGEQPIQTQSTETGETTEVTLPEIPQNTRPQESQPGHEGQNSGNTAGEAEKKLPDWLKTLGKVLLWTAVFLGAAAGQRQLRLSLRRKQAGKGSSNRRALARWRELELLYRRLGTAPPEELEALAQKAKFSQHQLTGQELQTLNAGLRTARSLCRNKAWYLRLIDQYIFAAY